MSVLKKLDPANKDDYQALRSLGMMSLQPHWKDVKAYLEEELHKIDVRNRSAAPYLSSRLGAQAELLQEILDKFNNALEIIGSAKVG